MGSRKQKKDSGTGEIPAAVLFCLVPDPRMVWHCFCRSGFCYVLGKEKNGSFQGIAGGSSVRDIFGFLRVRHDSGRGNFPCAAAPKPFGCAQAVDTVVLSEQRSCGDRKKGKSHIKDKKLFLGIHPNGNLFVFFTEKPEGIALFSYGFKKVWQNH